MSGPVNSHAVFQVSFCWMVPCHCPGSYSRNRESKKAIADSLNSHLFDISEMVGE